MNETIGYALIVIGLAFDFLGCLGLIRFPDVYTRLQASAKCITLGTCGILTGLICFKGLGSATGMKALLCMLFIILTAPVSAHALARASYRAGVKPWKGTVADDYQADMKNIK